MVVYAHMDESQDPPEFVLEFYVAPRLRRESTAVIGRYELGDPNFDSAGFIQDPLSADGGRPRRGPDSADVLAAAGFARRPARGAL